MWGGGYIYRNVLMGHKVIGVKVGVRVFAEG